MPSTHLSLHYHIVFSTKNHEPLIAKAWREELYAYMGGIIRNLGAIPEAIGGTEDHVHLLVGLKAVHRLADLLRDLKHSSSVWVHEKVKIPAFAWQEGYGAFTVSADRCPAVRGYISKQEEHHRRESFQQEYLKFLRQIGVNFDERYLW